MRKRLNICGFSEFEFRAMQFSFEQPGADSTGYEVVSAMDDADFVVVDAEAPQAVQDVTLAGRIEDAVFVGTVAPAGAAGHLTRPIDPTRILRILAEMIPRHRAPSLNEIVLLPLAAAAPAVPGALAPPAPATPDAPAPVSRQVAKAAARAAVRKAQLANRPAGAIAADETVPDVLVLDADPAETGRLVDLLQRFGFGVETATDTAEARSALAARRFAAIFLDIALDGEDSGEGLALLETIHALPLEPGQAAPAIVLVLAQLGPADRVRASLAGIGMPLSKPVSRGDVARALESRGVALPADARRT